MNRFENSLLARLVEKKVLEDLFPFVIGDLTGSENYIKHIIGRIKDQTLLNVRAEINHYGSGFSSYVQIFLGKRNGCDSRITYVDRRKTIETHGLMIYLSRLTPYAVYAEGNWSKTIEGGKVIGGGFHFIEPENIGSLPPFDWSQELLGISNILNECGYSFLTREELDIELGFHLEIPTLTDPPYKIFDCFFYWED